MLPAIVQAVVFVQASQLLHDEGARLTADICMFQLARFDCGEEDG